MKKHTLLILDGSSNKQWKWVYICEIIYIKEVLFPSHDSN
jgi:hypothetical protein